jgi:sigma-54 dependent transcriptional regulator
MAAQLVFESPASRALRSRLDQLAGLDVTVLVTGETGTGKELVTRYLHEHGPRRSGPFVAVNCGALHEGLVESELFGHERGAFTGAASAQVGWFQAADGGTLFLDELAEMPHATQVKLLRVLQQREIVRVGSRQPTSIDVRVIAATNVALHEAVAAGRFRADLFHRLDVATIEVPALRDRVADIVPLANGFAREYAHAPPEFSAEAIARLLAHDWPGNVRELRNVVQRAILESNGRRVEPAHIQIRRAVERGGPQTSGRLEAALTALFESRSVPSSRS